MYLSFYQIAQLPGFLLFGHVCSSKANGKLIFIGFSLNFSASFKTNQKYGISRQLFKHISL